MRYCSTVLAAVCFHDQRSMMRCRPRAPIVPRRSGCSRAQRILAASASLSPGGTTIAVSPSLPITPGTAPPVVPTSGAPRAMASMAGSDKLYYSDGTADLSAPEYIEDMARRGPVGLHYTGY